MGGGEGQGQVHSWNYQGYWGEQILLEVIWMIKWRMPLKCDFTTGWSAHKLPLVHVIEHHYTKHTANIAQSGIWCVWVPIPHPDTLSLEQWMVCISVDVPQIWFKSVSFEWGEEIGNNKQQKRTWAWRCCTVHPGESVDLRLSLIWMRQTSNKTKEKKKGDAVNYGLSVATETPLMQFLDFIFIFCELSF